MKNYAVLSVAILVCVIAALVMSNINQNDINITFAETKDEVTLSASFPVKDSERVEEYLQAQLQLNDLKDFRHLQAKSYYTPDRQTHFRIKSDDGHIKIVLDKTRSTSASYHQLKKIREGLNRILTQR